MHKALPPKMPDLILIAHALSDNDTTSSFYNKGKSTVFELIKNNCTAFEYLLDLHRSDCQPEHVATIVERFIISLYKGNL